MVGTLDGLPLASYLRSGSSIQIFLEYETESFLIPNEGIKF